MFNTVAFIESIEPDFEYQGLEGAMSLVIENAENFALINDVIDEGAEIAEEEAYTEGVVGATVKYVRKAIAWIIKNIKKAIAKLKSLFLSLVHKLKMAYLSAMRSIGKFVAKHAVAKHGGEVKVKWFKLDPSKFKEIVGKIGDHIEETSQELENNISTADYTKYNDDDELRSKAAGMIAYNDKFDKSKMVKEQLKRLTHDKKKAGDYGIFSEENTASASSSELKDLYDKCLVKTVNEVYKKTMKANNHLLKAAAKAEKSIDKNKSIEPRIGFGKQDKDGKYKSSASRPKMIIRALNAGVNTVISMNSALFAAVYKTAVFALHQNIKATVYAIKRTLIGDDAYKPDKDTRKAAKADLKNDYKANYADESAYLDIEDILA